MARHSATMLRSCMTTHHLHEGRDQLRGDLFRHAQRRQLSMTPVMSRATRRGSSAARGHRTTSVSRPQPRRGRERSPLHTRHTSLLFHRSKHRQLGARARFPHSPADQARGQWRGTLSRAVALLLDDLVSEVRSVPTWSSRPSRHHLGRRGQQILPSPVPAPARGRAQSACCASRDVLPR